MPGDLHKLWRTRDRKGYHVEYGFSCMGYEIAGGLGVKMAALDAGEDRDVFVMVGDGSYLMMAQEIVTAVAGGRQADRRARAEPRLRLDRRAVGVARLAALRHPLPLPHRAGGLDGDVLPVDLAANAASLGADVIRVSGVAELEKALRRGPGRRASRPSIHVETDPAVPAPDSPAWWDVPVAEVSALESTRAARDDVRAAQAAATRATCARPTRDTEENPS